MTTKEYGCEDACQDIHNYYRRALGDDVKEIDGMMRALKHVFVEGDERNIECERCHQYLKKKRVIAM